MCFEVFIILYLFLHFFLLNFIILQLLGFDVLLDEKLKPYIIEVNHTPSFATDTPLDSLIKKNAIKDSLKIMNISLKTRNEIV